jgi:hypothetical protein
MIRKAVQELLLDFSMTKKELRDFIKMSKHKLNKLLSCFDLDANVTPEQAARVLKLYNRKRTYDYQVQQCLKPMDPTDPDEVEITA